MIKYGDMALSVSENTVWLYLCSLFDLNQFYATVFSSVVFRIVGDKRAFGAVTFGA
ncbi:hypothetical protein KUH03_17520 [Sphingobacterium sp. E70]|uniref:hypothetical protein n=1 Tax=Sphingobacterium sp. E70 TaxID=2853439 RepID=UPI00211C71C3|nr:hypothetical protein [Sphingobacterium sp. E70]ULT28229.1 hypothetical protein KUH03_17520 [Sphingobacterium sp. E70]